MGDWGLVNRFGEDPDELVTLKGHQDGALYLVRGLQDEGFDPMHSTEQMRPARITHTFAGVAVHLDWDKREFDTPFIPMPIDPFGPRDRRPEGLAGNAYAALTQVCFCIGRRYRKGITCYSLEGRACRWDRVVAYPEYELGPQLGPSSYGK